MSPEAESADGLCIVEPATFDDEADPAAAAREAAPRASQDSDFLIRTGIWRALLSDVIYRPLAATAPRCLTPTELGRYNIDNVRSAPKD